MPRRYPRIDEAMAAKPSQFNFEPIKFGVDPSVLSDDDLRDEVIAIFASLPPGNRARLLWALRVIAATPAKERLRVVDEIDELSSRRSG